MNVNGDLLINKVDDPRSSGESEGVLTLADRESLWTTEFGKMGLRGKGENKKSSTMGYQV